MDWFGNKIVYCVLLCSLIYACKPAPEAEPGDRLIASVYNENLYWSEIQDIIPKDVSAQDSQLYVTGYINRWIKDQLMMREAERNIPKELNLEQLVNDYRKSLIRYNYEKLLVDNYQDSTVTPDELAAYYEKNKSQYPLKYTIIRCLYFKIDGKDKNLNKLRKEMAMDQLDVTQIQQLGDQANIQFTDTMKWYRALDIMDQIPGDRLRIRDLEPGKSYDVSDSGFHYVLRIIDRVKE
ncbi:MAG: peptidyl-prolyl cis-trans isomerase, partial [Saprospiraceae bacterium]|nr:peptidyl-prolyl cis-trans isomerase [Saprospiraceae bacterium]